MTTARTPSVMYLGGNLNKFSILKNSCATVALRGWNAAVGTRNGEPTAYHLDAASNGIFAFMDAPKGVRDNIVKTLPGYYLNNAQGVAEPDAGYQDETGWVYVSAPEKLDKEPQGGPNTLRTTLTGADKANAAAEVYTKGGEKTGSIETEFGNAFLHGGRISSRGDHAGNIALYISKENGNSHVAEGFCQHLQSDGFTCACRACHKAVTIGHLG